ncbi:MAG: hypothetical protein P4L03_00415 [Terracidiphilus sp.]|nr:hypothetical protein [Terracidiphilus sp.]
MKTLFPRTLPAAIALAALTAPLQAQVRLIHVFCNPAREFRVDSNPLFAGRWGVATDQNVVVTQLHAHSGRQTRVVIDGMEVNIVVLALGCGNWQRTQSKCFVESSTYDRIFES